jgi:hypothetical protein
MSLELMLYHASGKGTPIFINALPQYMMENLVDIQFRDDDEPILKANG